MIWGFISLKYLRICVLKILYRDSFDKNTLSYTENQLKYMFIDYYSDINHIKKNSAVYFNSLILDIDKLYFNLMS